MNFINGNLIPIALYVCKIFLVQRLSVVTSAPLIIVLFISIILAIFNGLKHQSSADGEARGQIQLIGAADVILFCLVLHQTDLSTFCFFLLLTAAAKLSGGKANRVRSLTQVIIGVLGYFLYPSSNLLDLGLVMFYQLTNSEYNRLKKQYSSSTIIQSEVGSAAALIMVLLLVSKDSGSAFISMVSTNGMMLVLGVAAGVVFYSHRIYNTGDHRLDLLTFAVLALVSLFFQEKQFLVRSIIAIIVTSIGAYFTLDKSSEVTDHNVIGDRKTQPSSNAFNTGKVIFIVVLTTFILIGHLNDWNADLKYAATLNKRLPALTWKYTVAENEGVRRQMHMQCLHKTTDFISRSIIPLIKTDHNYSLFEMPTHWNLGDSFIFGGNQLLLHNTGQLYLRGYPPYTSTGTFGKGKFKGTALFNGGGNFGDLYASVNRVRTAGVLSLSNATIVFLPQSIYYKNTTNAVKDNKFFERHRDLTMTFRDLESLAFSRQFFRTTKSLYVPDIAWMLGPQLPNTDPVVDILVLIRFEHESSQNIDKSPKPNFLANFRTLKNWTMTAVNQYPGVTAEVWDFPVISYPSLKDVNSSEILYDYGKVYPDRALPAFGQKLSTDQQIRYKTTMGNTLLSRGRVIITDRLHASVMATLLGKPVVYLETMYRKITRVRGSLAAAIDECDNTVLNARSARTLNESVALAVEFLKKMK